MEGQRRKGWTEDLGVQTEGGRWAHLLRSVIPLPPQCQVLAGEQQPLAEDSRLMLAGAW